ncbi:hypothetical protein Tco_0009557 [Tanacetum coccineum]
MQLEERELHQKCMARFKELKTHLEFLHNINNLSLSRNKPYEIAFQIFFQEEYDSFRMKLHHNLNQLQWQLESKYLHLSNPKSCLDVLRTPFKKFFDSKKVNAYDFNNKSWQKDFKDYTRQEPKTYKCNLLQYLDVLDKLIDERALRYGELQMKEREGTTLEASFSTDGTTLDASLVTEGTTLEACLVTEDADIEPSYDSDTMSEVHHDMFENVFSHGIQNHEQPESILDTYVVNENNSNIISDIPNMDPDRGKEEHDDVDYEQQRAFFASLINNLKCDVEKCNEVKREAQQANALLTNELERYKEKEKHFAKETTIEFEYCEKIKLLNDKISNLKSQACKKDKTFASENGKFDELRKAGQTDLTLHMLLPKEDNVNTGKQGLGFRNQNDDVNPSLLNKAKELEPSLYNIDEMGNKLLSNHKIISEDELKCEAEKRLKVKQRKSPLSYHGFVYVKDVNLQLNCFEKGLVKEMEDDLKYVMSLEYEFDETCLILDIQQEFFKTQFESVKSRILEIITQWKIDGLAKSRGGKMSPYPSLYEPVSLECSGNTTRIMHRTLMINLVFTLCEEQAIWNSVLMRLIDDLLALDSIISIDLNMLENWEKNVLISHKPSGEQRNAPPESIRGSGGGGSGVEEGGDEVMGNDWISGGCGGGDVVAIWLQPWGAVAGDDDDERVV